MDEAVTQEQLDVLAGILKPQIARVIGARPEQKLEIKVTCTPLDVANPTGPAVMRWEMTLDGQDLSPEQEQLVTTLFRMAGSDAMLVKSKA